jgi:peroxiredoxin
MINLSNDLIFWSFSGALTGVCAHYIKTFLNLQINILSIAIICIQKARTFIQPRNCPSEQIMRNVPAK